ncbi:unnamed protein product [Cercopithifilaria johnstoni]|uniref:Uncharacterized protein n=1 Tax=Cercopithifilaria johnstoni TaxID=2874296 RepID=A0A8J2Q7J0_9BILA|nr:unnamed protein product [Cercopithifilaria johnstoni]
MFPWGLYFDLDAQEQDQSENAGFNSANPSTTHDDFEADFVTVTNPTQANFTTSRNRTQANFTTSRNRTQANFTTLTNRTRQFIIHNPSASTYGQAPYQQHTPLITVVRNRTESSQYASQFFTTTIPHTSTLVRCNQTRSTNSLAPSVPSGHPALLETFNIRTPAIASIDHGVQSQLPSTVNGSDCMTLQSIQSQENNQILPKVTATSSNERSTILPSDTVPTKQQVHHVLKDDHKSLGVDSNITGDSGESVIEEEEHIVDDSTKEDEYYDLEKGLEHLSNVINLCDNANTKPEESFIVPYASKRIRELNMKLVLGDGTIRKLQLKIKRLNEKVISLRSSLPLKNITSTPRQKFEMKEFLEHYIKERTHQDYSFWIMAEMMQPLMDTLIKRLDQLPSDKILSETSNWLNVNFKLCAVRMCASTLLVALAKDASMLDNPNALQEYIQRELSQQEL